MSSVICEVKDGVMWITLNKPDKLNAIDLDMRNSIFNCLTTAESRDDVKVIVLTNRGNVFSIGADPTILKMMSEGSDYYVESFLVNYGIAAIGSVIRKIDKPVIAVVRGLCLNGGFELIQYCDLVYASEDSVFGHAEVNFNTMPGGGGTQNLPRIIGEKKAKEIIMLGLKITAKEAKELGIVNDVLPSDKLDDYVMDIINKLKSKDPKALAFIKKSINMVFDAPFSSGLDYERRMFIEQITSNSGRKGVEEYMKDPNKFI